MMDNLADMKKHLLMNIVGGVDAPGLPSEYARITSPDNEDNLICDLVENAIKQFVQNVSNAIEPTEFALDQLHHYLDVDNLSDCQAYVNKRLQLDMMKWACHVGKERLGFNEFYIDKEIYVRINFPFDYASKGAPSSITDPNHRLTEYNRGRAKATWGHGPHKDSWYGHSHSAINLWFAICGTNSEATMTLYPEHAYKATSFNAKSMYASYSENLGKNIKLSLKKGENFIFDPELLHSSRLNTSNETRIVLTLRLSQEEPLFSKNIHHDVYNMWVSSADIDRGEIIPREVGKKVEIEDFPETTEVASHYVHRVDLDLMFTQKLVMREDFEVSDNIVFELCCNDGDCLAVWSDGKLYKFAKFCPHVGAPLLKGVFDTEAKTLKCPAHGAEFCLQSGACGSKSLRLKVFGN